MENKGNPMDRADARNLTFKKLLTKIILILLLVLLVFISLRLIDLQNIELSNAKETDFDNSNLRDEPNYKEGELLIITRVDESFEGDVAGILEQSLKENLSSTITEDTVITELDTEKGVLGSSTEGNESQIQKVYMIEFNPDVPVETALSDVRKLPNVVHVQPNYKYELSQETYPNDPYYNDVYKTNSNSRDWLWNPKYNYQWNLQAMNAQKGWEIEKGSEDVIIGVIDSGIDYDHEDLVGKVILGKDYINNDNDPKDDYGHGTHVAGIIAANTNNGKGMASVCPNCKLYASKVFSYDGTAYTSQITQGIYDTVDAGARVINASFGGYLPDPLLEMSIAYAHDNKVVFVAAAGNEAVPASGAFPANADCSEYTDTLDCVLTVGASGQKGKLSIYSNYGDAVDVVAPGGDFPPEYNILSAKSEWIGQDLINYVINRKYLRLSGTSMAAPHISGLAGLIISKDPTLSAEEVRNIIMNSTGNKIVKADNKVKVGIANIHEALTEMDTSMPTLIKDRQGTQITSPKEGTLMSNNFEIIGTMAGEGFKNYTIEIMLPNTKKWTKTGVTLVNGGNSPVYANKLADISINNVLTNVQNVSFRITNNIGGKTYTKILNISVHKSINSNFPINYTAPAEQPITIADINEDGRSEIVFSDVTKGTINVIDSSGNPISGWPVFTGDTAGMHSDSLRGYIISDTHPEIPGKEIITNFRPGHYAFAKLQAFQSDGQEIINWSNYDWSLVKQSGFWPTTRMAIDPLQENTIVSVINDKVNNSYVHNLASFNIPNYPLKYVFDNNVQNLAVGDLDCDNNSEIVVRSVILSYPYNDTIIYVLKDFNNVISTITPPEFPGSVNTIFEAQPILVDVDNNGDHEIVSMMVAKYVDSTPKHNIVKIEKYLAAWDELGNLKGTPTLIASIPGSKAEYSFESSIVPVNLDEDIEPEFVTLTQIAKGTNLFQAHNIDGTKVQGFNKTIKYADDGEDRKMVAATLKDGKVLVVLSGMRYVMGYSYDKNTHEFISDPLIDIQVPINKEYLTANFTPVSLGELEGDDQLQLVVGMSYGGGTIIGQEGIYPDQLFVLDTGLSVNKIDWSQYGYDSGGTYAVPSNSTCEIDTPTLTPTPVVPSVTPTTLFPTVVPSI